MGKCGIIIARAKRGAQDGSVYNRAHTHSFMHEQKLLRTQGYVREQQPKESIALKHKCWLRGHIDLLCYLIETKYHQWKVFISGGL